MTDYQEILAQRSKLIDQDHPKCPTCGCTEFYILKDKEGKCISTLPVNFPSGIQVLITVCKNCGFIGFHSENVLSQNIKLEEKHD